MIELKLIVPEYEKEDDLQISLLKEVGEQLEVRTSIEKLTKAQLDEIKFKLLIPIAVSKRIGLKQTRKTKSMYAHLLVFLDGEIFTFYPQRYGDKEITTKEFLAGLEEGNILCLHDKGALGTYFAGGGSR